MPGANDEVQPRPRQSNGSASALALAGAAGSTIANFGVAIAVNHISTAFAGIFFVSVSVITILGNSSCLGTMTGLVYFMPKTSEGTTNNPRSLLAIAFGPVLAVGTLFAAIVALSASTIGELVADKGAEDVAQMIRVLAITIPLWGLTVAIFGATRGLGSMTPTALIGRVFRPVAQVVLIGAVALSSDNPNPAAVALAWAIPVVVAAVAGLVALQRLGGFANTGQPQVSAGEFWRFVRPRSVSTALQITLERVDVIIVSALAPQAGLQAEVASGIYGSLSRFITAANFLVASLTQAVTPKIRRAFANENGQRAQHLIDQTTGWMVMILWPYLLILALQPKPIIGLVASGDDAALGTTALTILALGVLFSPAAGPADGTLLMLGRSGWSLAGTAIAVAIDLILLALLVPRFGLTGAAVAWVAAVITANLLPLSLTNRFAGLRPFPGRPAFIAAAGALAAVLPLGLLVPDTRAGLFWTTGVAGLGMAAYVWFFAGDLSVPLEKIRRLRSP